MAGWYVRRGATIIGPIGVDTLKDSVAAGKLLPTDHLAKDSAGPWTEASKTKLFAKSETPPPPPIAPTKTEAAKPKKSRRALWVVRSLVILAVVSAAAVPMLRRDNEGSVAVESAGNAPSVLGPVDRKPTDAEPTRRLAKPFEYKILNEEWSDGFWGETAKVEVQVSDDVAPTVTKADLESLAPVLLEKYDGKRFFVYFYTVTPLTSPWASIIHNPRTPIGEELECSINEYAFEFGPWYFPDRIDRNTKWHELVWLTLPKVNKIVNGATQFQWEVTSRSANAVYFDFKQRPNGGLNDTMRLSPQTWDISTSDGDVPRFVRLVESSLNYLDYEFSQKIVGKLNSVIGSQEYLNGDKTYWEWTIDRLEVTYHHTADVSDTITIMQTAP